LKTRILDSNPGGGAGPSAQQAAVLHILFGTQTGNAEAVANDIAAEAGAQGFSPAVQALDDVEIERLSEMERVAIVTSTYGEGEMPDNALAFWTALSADTAPRLEHLSFAVLGLGDTAYDAFCQAAKLI